MPKTSAAKELFTASEVARFCQVDLKTIHNWADRGEIHHFRTPGRHLRFRRSDVLDFLRKYGYPVPEQLREGKPTIVVVDEDAAVLESTRRALAGPFQIVGFSEPVDALVAIGHDAPDVFVLDAATERLDAVRCIARLRDLEQSRHVRVVVYSARPELRQRTLDAGASAFVAKPDTERLADAIKSLVGA